MMSRGRRLAIFLPVIVTVLLAGVLGAFVVIENQRASDEVATADAIGEEFESDVATFRSEVTAALKAAPGDDPGTLRTALEAAITDPPALRDAPGGGAEQSATYVAAQETERTLLQPYRRLSRELRRADVASRYIAVARDALRLRASDYVGGTLLADSADVRSRLIPAFVAARDKLAAVRVPTGQEKLAVTVRGAIQHVIDEATALANAIDANRSYTFTYREQFQAAIDAVEDYATTVDGDVTEALNAVTSLG
jgi:hypothetical protein